MNCMITSRASSPNSLRLLFGVQASACFWLLGLLVVMNINTVTFAARDFWPRRGASDEHTAGRSVRSEQRSLGKKELPPAGLRRIWPVASLLVGYSPIQGDAPSSRLATGQIGRNERHRIYVHDHLAPAQSIPLPAAAAFDLTKLAEMDSEITQAIAENKLPGAVLWLERHSESYHNAYGNCWLVPASRPMCEDVIFD